MGDSGFVGSLASAFSEALSPLREGLGSEQAFGRLLRQHGWEPPSVMDIAEVQAAFAVLTDFDAAAELLAQVPDADGVAAVGLVLDAIAHLQAVLSRLQALAADPPTQLNLPSPLDQAAFWTELPGELGESLFATWLERHQPRVSAPMVLLGIIGKEWVTPTLSGRVPYLRSSLRWERLPQLLEPEVLINEVFYDAAGVFLARELIDLLGLAALIKGVRGVLIAPDDDFLDPYYAPNNPARDALRMLLLPLLGGSDSSGPYGLALTVLPIPAAGDLDGPPVGVAIGPALVGAPQAMDLGVVSLRLEGGFQDDRGLQIELRPGGVSVAPALSEGVFAELSLATDEGEPFVLVGAQGGTRLEAGRFRAGLRAEGTLSGAELRFDLDLDGVRMVFDTSEGDPFTKKVAGADAQQLGFSTGLSWSTRHGLTLRGQVGLDAYVPVNVRVGPVSIDTLALSLASRGGALVLSAGATGAGRLGPLTVIVQELGVELRVRPVGAGQPPGNLGVLDVGFGFKAPSGYGLKLAVSESIQGDGFLARDGERWVGAMNLRIQQLRFSGLAVTEQDSLIGLLWFQGLKIPLFGGFITATGALLAYHRRSDREAFLGALSTGALEALMFPADPVAQAPALAAQLLRLLPYDADRSVAGVMARWVFGGEAELVRVDLGLLAEFSGAGLHKIIAVGRGRARLEDLPEDIFRINVDMYGEWDLGRGELLVLASLRDSRLVGGELSGDGLLYSGPLAGFVLSLGGYNPRYAAPAGLPPLRRLSAQLVDSAHVKLGVELYFALTSCNVQFGVKAALWAGIAGFSITGGFGLDALMRFDFHMIVDLFFEVTLRRGSQVLASIGFSGVLEGVSPFRVDGEASLSLLFLSVSVPVSVQIGDDGGVTPAVTDALEPLRQAIASSDSWSGGQDPGVVLRGRDDDAVGVWASPGASLRMSQQVAPFGLELTHLGPSPLAQPQRFELESVAFEGVTLASTPVEEDFSLGLYQDVDLEESIRAPMTEPMESGFELAFDAVEVGAVQAGSADYDDIVVDLPLEAGAETTTTQSATTQSATRTALQAEPTSNPKGGPSSDPTTDPREEPTEEPTTDPRGEPSGEPTEDPTGEPSMSEEPPGPVPRSPRPAPPSVAAFYQAPAKAVGLQPRRFLAVDEALVAVAMANGAPPPGEGLSYAAARQLLRDRAAGAPPYTTPPRIVRKSQAYSS